MALLWFVIGLLVGAGVVIGGIFLMLAGMKVGEKKANAPIETDDAEVK